ncbi:MULTISPECIES: 5-(carboxyamino)imidazole ribonucleotide mutase [Prochlorococcus]|uniref:5-(carboxyamino)imidazole ribonucleotide mutase n=1 Tax=Prochlorococcus TaxID=1218 RepID=UPI0005338C6B|nr:MULTISPECIES: 5-(carboxyamino)imidazole ribonucleotide mutase [Prochlorococcus]KGG13206.1 Phosphoribosylaminoimidazole carboxylase catalytic subunit [Prochlorococcus sp. MIT 0601]
MNHASRNLSSEDAEQKALVAVVMGSDSDLPTLEPAISLLEELQIDIDVRILSAHRTPGEMIDFAKKSESIGLKVIIAGAGGAAHLPGMIASLTTVPVVGVPVSTQSLSGVDSLYSIVQMPKGIPVATVAIGGGLNAGLLAAQILSTNDKALQIKIAAYRKKLHAMVVNKDKKLNELGVKKYISNM